MPGFLAADELTKIEFWRLMPMWPQVVTVTAFSWGGCRQGLLLTA
jgi:hypothetical protein